VKGKLPVMVWICRHVTPCDHQFTKFEHQMAVVFIKAKFKDILEHTCLKEQAR
jgi:hypothetical protein